MAITSLDQLVANLPGQHRHILKSSVTTEGAGTWHSLFLVAGQPAAGATPPAFSAGSGYVPTSATAGAIPFTNPPGGTASFLAKLAATLSVAGTVILYDRLWHCSGFNTTTLTAQTVTTPGSLTRPDANGTDVELWGEIYTAPGATGATWTVSYTNQDGTAGRTATYTHPANAETVGQMVPFKLQSGDTGVRSVQSLTCSASSGTAGNLGLTLLRRLAEIPIDVASGGKALDAFALGLPQVYDSACLCFMLLCSGTSSGNFQAGLDIVNDAVVTGATQTIVDVMHFQAETLDDASPNTPVTTNATLTIDALTDTGYRVFTGNALTAAGGRMIVPNATSVKVEWSYRSATANGGTNNKNRWRFGKRAQFSTGAEVTLDFADHTVANNTNVQTFSQTVSLASLGLAAGDAINWQIQKLASGGVTNGMSQDSWLTELKLTFIV